MGKSTDDCRETMVRIVSPTLAENAGVEVGSVHEAIELVGFVHDVWLDEDGRAFRWDVWIFDGVEPGDPPVGWYAHDEDVEVVEKCDDPNCELHPKN